MERVKPSTLRVPIFGVKVTGFVGDVGGGGGGVEVEMILAGVGGGGCRGGVGNRVDILRRFVVCGAGSGGGGGG